jgi:hypothetical protein
MTTSGAPFFAETAVWNFWYWGWPWPAFVQHTWTSVCWLLKLSTTLAMFGYHAQSDTRGACSWTILLVQLVGCARVSPSPSSPQAVTPRARVRVRIAMGILRIFLAS